MQTTKSNLILSQYQTGLFFFICISCMSLWSYKLVENIDVVNFPMCQRRILSLPCVAIFFFSFSILCVAGYLFMSRSTAARPIFQSRLCAFGWKFANQNQSMHALNTVKNFYWIYLCLSVFNVIVVNDWHQSVRLWMSHCIQSNLILNNADIKYQSIVWKHLVLTDI